MPTKTPKVSEEHDDDLNTWLCSKKQINNNSNNVIRFFRNLDIAGPPYNNPDIMLV